MSHHRVSGKMVNRWWLSRLLAGAVVFVFLFLFACYRIPASVLSGYVKTHIKTEEIFTPEDFDLEAVDFEVGTEDNLTIKGKEFRASETSKGVVILVPGLFNPVASSLYGHVKYLLSMGYSAIVFQTRAHGDSDGKTVGHGISEVNDINAVIEYVRSFTAYLNTPIILMGWNTGAAASINTAAQNQHINGVISVGTYSDVKGYFIGLLENQAGMSSKFVKFSSPFLNMYLKLHYGSDVMQIAPDNNIGKLDGRPVLLIHSTGDNFISSDESQLLADSAPENTDLWIRDIEDEYATPYFINLEKDPEYCGRLLSFLEEVENKAAEQTAEEK